VAATAGTARIGPSASRRRLTRVAGVLIVLAALGGCVAPAPSLSAYQSKAARTASAALSEVQTARLAVRQAQLGRIPHAYADVLVSGAEDAFAAVQGTFDLVQPPDDPAADKARTSLDEILSDGADLLGRLRIALRRQRADQLARLAEQLAPVAAKLSEYDPAAVG